MATMTCSRSITRTVPVVLVVLALHAVALWALKIGSKHRPVEVVMPIEVLSEAITPPRPSPPPPPPAVHEPAAARTTRPEAPPPRPQPAMPMPLAAPINPEPSPQAPTATATAAATPPSAQPAAPATAVPPALGNTGGTAAMAPAPVEARTPAPPRIELPSSDAAYLQNPRPVYPPMSRRLREEGTVLVHVLIGVDGTAKKAEIQQSSGFYRLDETALATVLKWRYVPGRRNGVPEEMSYIVPIAWNLK